MTPAQRNLLDAAKHLLDVLADPIVAYELTIDNATNRLDDAIKAAEADDSLGLTDEEIDAGVRDSCYAKVGFPLMADYGSVDEWAKRMTEMQRDAFRAAVAKHQKERGGC